MTIRTSCVSGAPVALMLGLLAWWAPAAALAQGKSDVVTLANGDRITGEVKRLERGRLVFETDDAGTLYLEWDKLASVESKQRVEVTTADGQRYLGSLGPAPDRSVAVIEGTNAATTLAMTDVTELHPIGRRFWSKVDGSLDVGFSYTRSSGVAQLNFNSDTVYRRAGFEGRVTAAATQTRKDDDPGRDDRAYVEIAYLRYPWRRWFLTTAGRFETNESLGLNLRSQFGGAIGPRLINSNRAQMTLGAGVVVNDEQGVDVESSQSIEAMLLFRTSYYTYDRPKTNMDVSLHYYPSLSESGRHRVQFDAAVKREVFKDLFVSLNGFNTYDSRPPNPAFSNNDVGVVLSVGWSY